MIVHKIGISLILLIGFWFFIACAVSLDDFYGEYPTDTTMQSSIVPTTTQPTSTSTTKQTSTSESLTSTSQSISSTSSTTETTTTTSTTVEDFSPPYFIIGPLATDIGSTSVSIAWSTNEVTTGHVEYSTEQDFVPGTGTLSTADEDFTLGHTINLSGLLENQVYYYRVYFEDSNGNETVSGLYSFSLFSPQMLISANITEGSRGDAMILNGYNFGFPRPTGSYVVFTKEGGGWTSASITNWIDSQIELTIPMDAVSGPYKVYNGSQFSNELSIDLWSTELVADGSSTSNRTDMYTDLIYDDLDNPYISYCNHWSGAYYAAYLRYYDGVDWLSSNPEGSTYHRGNNNTNIRLDSFNRMHMVYYQSSNQYLQYAYHNGTVWQAETVDSSATTGVNANFVIDSTDTVHIVYYNTTTEILKYAVGTFGSWTLEDVDTNGRIDNPSIPNGGKAQPILFSGAEEFYVAYYGGMRINWAKRNAPADWTHEIIDQDGDVGRYVAATCSDTICYIAYTSDGRLKFASKVMASGDWEYEIIDDTSSNNVGKWVTMDLDTSGEPHIMYYDTVNNILKYAYNVEGSWEITDLMSNVRYPVINLPSTDNLCFAYGQDYDLLYSCRL